LPPRLASALNLGPPAAVAAQAQGRAAVGRTEKNVAAGPVATAIDSGREKEKKRTDSRAGFGLIHDLLVSMD
jgi:hypothetical protein